MEPNKWRHILYVVIYAPFFSEKLNDTNVCTAGVSIPSSTTSYLVKQNIGHLYECSGQQW